MSNGYQYLLDTNIISEPMKPRPNPNVMKQLELNSIFSCTSATVWMELWHGIHQMPGGKRKRGLTDYVQLLVDDGFEVSHIALDVSAKITEISTEKFEQLCEQTKQGCPISKLMNAEISLTTKLN